ncbi:MAG: DUF1223 domain-containing protein [Rubrivivax sp.]|nr:DUF1223 domain-containing protein [Rubrivivax sp.]
MRILALLPLLAGFTALGTPTIASADSCQARSTASAPTVVELYTSEGCSSCPPADRWLSSLKGRPGVLALAYHVDYWDRLGWADRFASPAFTDRQRALARRSGSATVYTPQVVVDGRDWRGWPQLPRAGALSPIMLQMSRDGDVVRAEVAATASAPARLAGYWAVLEDGHASKVRAGENDGKTLLHDHVVRLQRDVPAWTAADGARWQITVATGDAAFPRRIAFIVVDASTMRPLHALALAC